MKVREVEYYRNWGGDSGTWDTDFILIPANTPDEPTPLDAAVRAAACKIDWHGEPPQFVGFYAYSDGECEICGAFETECEDMHSTEDHKLICNDCLAVENQGAE